MEKKELELLTDIRDRIAVFNEFGYDIDNDEYESIDEALDDVFSHHKVQFAKGVSKLCIIPEEANWVVKVPFEGFIQHWYDFDNNGNEESHEEFCYNMGAGNSRNEWDYCLTEVEYYELAKDNNIADFFAKAECFGECRNGSYKTLPAYIQEKCITISDLSYEDDKKYAPSENSLKRINSSQKYDSKCFDKNWMASAIDFYGEEKLDELFSFLKEHPQISDFHWANYGYRISDGSPVLIDYTGWHD